MPDKYPALFFLFLPFLLFSCLATHNNHALSPTSVFAGTVVKVTNGDTFWVENNDQKIRVHLYGIDCPEIHQPWGREAKAFVYDTLMARPVTVHITDNIENKGSKNIPGTVQGIVRRNSVCLQEELLLGGLAWVRPEYCNRAICDNWLELEATARAGEKGLWQEKTSIPPWRWRKIIRSEIMQ